MRRVVVTGMGVISSIGNNIKEVTNSLQTLKSGISLNEINKEMGLRSHISGNIKKLELTLKKLLFHPICKWDFHEKLEVYQNCYPINR